MGKLLIEKYNNNNINNNNFNGHKNKLLHPQKSYVNTKIFEMSERISLRKRIKLIYFLHCLASRGCLPCFRVVWLSAWTRFASCPLVLGGGGQVLSFICKSQILNYFER